MKVFVLSVVSSLLFLSSKAFAESNIAGVKSDMGLIIKIIDDPSNGPFTAGELLDSMTTDTIQTANFKMKCVGATQNGNRFGSCTIQASNALLLDQGSTYAFAISHEEAAQALAGFVPRPINFLVRAKSSKLTFEANWQYQMVALFIDKSLVQE